MADELVGIIGGTGLGDALAEQLTDARSHEVETPFGKPSTSIIVGRLGTRPVAFLNRHGKSHKLSPSEVPYAANIFALKQLGVHTIIGSGAVGSLQEQIAPGEPVVVDQFIDKTFKRTNTFFRGFGAVHCEMAEPLCNRLRTALLDAAKTTDVNTHPEGTYVCMEGPQFSSRAESLMHRAWGGDLIGMTAMPEADYDCWRPHEAGRDKQTLLKEIIANLQAATENCLKLIRAVLQGDADLVCADCSCRRSLDLAVWTDQAQIEAAHREKLKVLFE
ncbi:MAG: MTAP family purine nucleoside phosphorylase [Planctomycetota bacterium]|jgi:5'-methylthioadenosine phosphorylase